MSRSIYQTNGKPLSQQALYQQKLKQGIYTTPTTPSVGVNSSASDTAALLAASTDLTVKPSYERTVAPEAHNAAIAARSENYTAWLRENADPLASSAASSAKVPRTSTITSTNLLTSTGTGIPAYKGDKVFAKASSNSTLTLTSRISPEKLVSRHGLVSKPSSSAGTTLNIAKISQVANQKSTKSLNNRFNPELDHRSGIQNKPEYLTDSEEKLAAEGASASLKHGGNYTHQVSSQTRTKSFKAVDVVDATLLAAALAKAQDRLKSLNSTTSDNFKAQAQAYANALAIAQKNSEERIKNHKAGAIDLGGGLTIAQSEIDKLASSIVQPVLLSIESKAQSQRELDQKQKQKHAELLKIHNKLKQEAIAAKNKEKADIEKAKQERIAATNDKKKVEDGKLADHQKQRDDEVAGRVQEFKALQEKLEGEKQELLKKKQDNQDRIDAEEAELVKGRKDELDALQTEKDAIVKPVLDELTEEKAKLKNLTNARDELQNEVDAAEKLNAEYEAKLTELQEQLDATEADISKYTDDLADVSAKFDESQTTVDELKAKSIETLQKHEDTHKDYDAKIAELEATKAEHLKTKQLQKQEILDHIDEKIKDEHKINNELPEHLRKTIDEDKLRDTSSLFTVEEVAEEPVQQPEVVDTVQEPPTKVAKTKKKGFRSKISGIFKKEVKEVKKVVPKRTVETRKDTTAESASAEKKPESVKPTESVKPESIDESKAVSRVESEVDFDDISIDRSKNQGGVFKEQI